MHRPGGGPRVVEDPEENDQLPPSDSPVSFLCYVYCCMCVGGNAKKGFHACCRDVWDDRECVWCRGMKGLGRGMLWWWLVVVAKNILFSSFF